MKNGYYSMTFLATYRDILYDLPDALRVRMYDAVLDYGLKGIEPDFSDEPALASLFRYMKLNIDQVRDRENPRG